MMGQVAIRVIVRVGVERWSQFLASVVVRTA